MTKHLDHTLAQVVLERLAQVSIPTSVIPDSTLYQVPARTMRGPAQTTVKDLRPRARRLEVLQEDIRGIPQEDSPGRYRRQSVVEEDFKITHRTRTRDTVTTE